MLKLFGKKPAKEPEAPPEKSAELAALGAQFAPEEFTLLAVTGASAFTGAKGEEDGLWRAGIDITAWLEEDGDGPAVREPARLVALADDKLMAFLRQRTPRDSIIRAKVRRAKEGGRFLLVDLPEPAMEPELKAILEEQKKPVTVSDPQLGEFTLDRAVNWFAAEVEWLGQPIQLTFDWDENLADCFQSAHALMDDQEGWDARIRGCAADRLLEQANDWAADSAEEGEEAQPVTREEFMARMEADSLQVYEDGSFEFWFHDGELFWGHSIHVSGSLTDGPTDAQMEG